MITAVYEGNDNHLNYVLIVYGMSTSERETEECSELFTSMKKKWDDNLDAIKNDVWKALEEDENGTHNLTERDKSNYTCFLCTYRRGICLHYQFNVLQG